MFAVGSLVASLVGLVALAIDLVLAVQPGENPQVRLAAVYLIADLIGMFCGAVSANSTTGKIGLYLSWAPLVAALVAFIGLRPNLAAEIVRACGSVMGDIARGLGTFITNLVA